MASPSPVPAAEAAPEAVATLSASYSDPLHFAQESTAAAQSPLPEIRPGNNQAPGTDFKYPAHYSFPPFYTLQPNLTTQASQFDSWQALVLSFCRHQRQFRINTASPLFENRTLKRKLSPEHAKLLFGHMAERGRADFIGAEGSRAASSSARSRSALAALQASGRAEEVWVWWKTPDEWASSVLDWVEETGQKNTVLTFYELLEGDTTASRDFHGMPREMLQIALRGLVKRGKANVFGEDDQQGVKFY